MMEVKTTLDQDSVCARINVLFVSTPWSPNPAFEGRVSGYQFIIRVLRKPWSLPWRGTFRGAAIGLNGMTAIEGKFDSNWALYFVGYPLLLGIGSNVALSLLWGYGIAYADIFIGIVAAAVLLCALLHWRHERDKRIIARALRSACESAAMRSPA